MERIGAMRDNLSENASTMALAGASITGSLSGSAMVNCFNRSVTPCLQVKSCAQLLAKKKTLKGHVF